MILNQDNEYTALLDAAVLVPMCLCDTLLTLAEDPAMYRPLWSDLILQEVGHALEHKIKLTPEQCQHRITEMRKAFPEALVVPPLGCHEPGRRCRHSAESRCFGVHLPFDGSADLAAPGS